jgi:hypothetical protein
VIEDRVTQLVRGREPLYRLRALRAYQRTGLLAPDIGTQQASERPEHNPHTQPCECIEDVDVFVSLEEPRSDVQNPEDSLSLSRTPKSSTPNVRIQAAALSDRDRK